MNIPLFRLEEFWKKYEFTAPYLLCCSDAEPWTMKELLSLADEDSLKLWDTLSLGYTESPGLPLLREEIAKLYKTISPGQLLTLAGAEEGIYCAMRSLLTPDDHVITLHPIYQSLDTLPRAFGCSVTAIPLRAENSWQLDLEEVRKAFRPNTKMISFNYPHNPTGTLLPREILQGIIDLAREHNAYIFSDEVYRYLEIDENDQIPSIADIYEKGISLNVMTKAFGLAGLRIGWIASKDHGVIEKIGSYKLYTSICNSAPSEILAIMALRAKEKLLERNRNIMLHNLQLIESLIERYPKVFSWIPPQSGTTALIQLKLPISIDEFAEDLVNKVGVLIMPATLFDLPGNFFRIGFGRKNMPEVLQHFERYITTKVS